MGRIKVFLSIGFIVLLLLNMLLFAFGVMRPLAFWAVILVSAAVAYLVLPRLKKSD